MTLRTLAALALFVVVVPRADAQPATAQAEIMFRKGKQLLADGKTAEACAAFDASQKLDPTVSTLLNQANCRDKNGQLATAWGLFLEAERQTRGGSEENRQLHQVATTKAAKLEPRLSTLTIAAVPASGLEVRRDAQIIDPATWNQALPIDGGTYKITARAPGKVEWSATVKIENERDAKTVTVPKLDDVKKAAPPPAPLPPPIDPWFCTETKTASSGTCKPKRDQCEASRATLRKQFSDLTPCHGAMTASCFRMGTDLHCGPTGEICDALRAAAVKQAAADAKVSPCRSQHDANEPEPPPKPKGPPWSCTESKSRNLGICKPDRRGCDASRSSMLSRASDLSACHDQELAVCFSLDDKPHCAPNNEICDAMREVARRDDNTKQLGSCSKMSQPAR